MNFQQIECFFAVTETGNFTQAAELIYSSQPTVSRQISLLENEVGYRLFDRDSKPLKLTAPGKVLYDGLKESMSQFDHAIESAKVASEGKSGKLTIAFQAGYYPEYIFLSIVNQLRQEHPDIKIHCLKLMSCDMIVGLKNDTIDIGIGLDFPHWHEAGFQVDPLTEVETLVVMTSRHPLAKKKAFDYNDFSGETFYLTAPNGYEVCKVLGDKYALDNIHQVKVDNSEIAYFKVLAENGLTISNPYDPTLLNNPNYSYAPINPEYKDRYVCVYKNAEINPTIQLFLSSIPNTNFFTPM